MKTKEPTDGAVAGPSGDTRFLRRVLIVAGVVVLALFLWVARSALLLGFAAIIAGLVIDTVALPFRKYLGWRRGRAMLAGIAVLILVIGGVFALIGTQIAAQVGQLTQALPQAAATLEQRTGIDLDTLKQAGSGMLGEAATLALSAANAFYAVILAVVAGTFLAGDPDRYKRGLLQLVPRRHDARFAELLDFSGNALRQWLLGTALNMAIIGGAVALGTWALGLPAPLALGLAAGLAEFVPVVGAIAGAVPSLLLAASVDGETVLWTVGLFLLIQQVESNMLAPYVQQKLVQIDAPILLFGVVAAGAVLGTPGLILAAPLTVVATIAVQLLYIRGALGEATEVPGEEDGPKDGAAPARAEPHDAQP